MPLKGCLFTNIHAGDKGGLRNKKAGKNPLRLTRDSKKKYFRFMVFVIRDPAD
jgi:hypothetical protein